MAEHFIRAGCMDRAKWERWCDSYPNSVPGCSRDQQYRSYGPLPAWASNIDPLDLAARLVGGIVELSARCGYSRVVMSKILGGNYMYPKQLATLLALFEGMFKAEHFIQADYIRRPNWELWCNRHPDRVPECERDRKRNTP